MRHPLFLMALLIFTSAAFAEHNEVDALAICQFRTTVPELVEPCKIILEAERKRERRLYLEGLQHDLEVVTRAATAVTQTNAQ